MTLRVDIEKENFESIKFPDICPVCGKESPNSHTKMRTYFGAIQPLNEKMVKDWGLEIPVCKNHKKYITFGRIISGALFLLFIGIGALLLYILWTVFGNQGNIINIIVCFAVIGMMIYAHGKSYAAPLLIESFSYRLLFTFKSDDLAIKFARMNNTNKVFNIMNQGQELPEDKNHD